MSQTFRSFSNKSNHNGDAAGKHAAIPPVVYMTRAERQTSLHAAVSVLRTFTTSYNMFQFALLFIASYVCSASALPPCVCARDFHPVCGSDGHTYPNDCMFNCAAHSHRDLKLAHQGSCNQDQLNTCICTMEYKPVCGIDDTTYPNECALRCEKSRNSILEKQYDGPCKSQAISEEVKVADIPKLPPCTCTRNLVPVCGTDGVTYNNICLLKCAAEHKPLDKKADGPCDGLSVKVVEQPRTSCVCTRNYSPVCGSDGTTYANPCLLGCKTNTEPELKMVRDGPCEEVQ